MPTCAPSPSLAESQEGPTVETNSRSRRMIGFYSAIGALILLLMIAGANWRVLHLTYCRHLMKSEDYGSRNKGVRLLIQVHFQEGMTLAKVRQLARPAKVRPAGIFGFSVHGRSEVYRLELLRNGASDIEYGPQLSFAVGDELVLMGVPALDGRTILGDD
jgi:hypothetical protein